MIIYCAGPIRGDVTYQKFYTNMIDYIENQGHTVLAEFSDKFSSTIPLTDKQTYKRNLKWIDGSKLMIAEISGPSLGVGFEIAYAIFQRKIPVFALCILDAQNVSFMLSGCDSPLLSIQKYKNVDDMKSIIKNFLSKINKS